MLFLIVIVILFTPNLTYEHFEENNFDELYVNLIESLRQDPLLIADVNFTSTSQEFVDKQIENFLGLVKVYNHVPRYKRSVTYPNEDENIVGLDPYLTISDKVAKDVRLFQQNSSWYAASLESTREDNKYFDLLIIRKYQVQDLKFTEVSKINISDGNRIAVFPMEFSTIIIVADNSSLQSNVTKIFNFDNYEHLEIIQSIYATNLTDVVIWEHKHNIFMCAAHFMKGTHNNGISFEVEMPLYKWRGRHFDEIQYIKGSGTRRISVFSIRDVSYIAVANTWTNDDNGKIYSDILKFNPHTEKYEVFERLLTNTCTHIKYFKTKFNEKEEHFIITANFLSTGNSSMWNNDGTSVIYKFIDNYFIPFHSVYIGGVSEWESITMDNGNVILLGSTLDGLQCLEYDGWRFEKCIINSTSKTIIENNLVNAMHFEKFQHKNILAVAFANNNQNIYELRFTLKNTLQDMHDEMLQWCQNRIEELNNIDYEMVGDSIRGDVEEIKGESHHDVDENERTLQSLNTFESQLIEMQKKLQKSLQSTADHIIDYDVNATNIILENLAILNNISTNNINNITLQSILANVLNINDGFEVDSKMEFRFVRVEHEILPLTINDIIYSDLVTLNQTLNVDTLEIEGTASFKSGVTVNDTIDGVTVRKEKIILRHTPQKFEKFSIDNIDVDHLRTDNLIVDAHNKTSITDSEVINHLEKLNVKNLTLGGYLNGVDVPTLNKYTLRKTGDQIISGIYYFDNLIVSDNLDTDTLSDKAVLEDFVRINEGSYKINKDVRFSHDLFVNNLTVFEYLNKIPVVDGELDVLVKNSNETQHISGIKTFENLTLLDSIQLRGKIRNKDFDTMNPLVTINRDLNLDGDIEITGDVRSEEILKADNIVSSQGVSSLRKLQSEGLKLTEPEIPVRFSFSQHLNIRDVFAERINNVDPRLWVVNGAKEKQIVTGWKKFRGDLEITGNTNVLRINDIDMEELKTNVLKKDGDQVIMGKHYVKYVAVEKRLISNNTKFGTNSWTDVITASEDQVISGTTVFSTNLTATSVFASNVQINGLINEQNLSEFIKNTVMKDSHVKISGLKNFRNLTIGNLEIDKDLNMLRELNDEVLNLPDLKNIDIIDIEHINFNKRLNDIDNTDLQEIIEGNSELTLDGDRQFQKVLVFGKVYVKSNRINNIELDDVVNNTIKLDEPVHFDFVEFKNDVIVDKVKLNGHVENLDLDNIVQNGVNVNSIITSDKIFHECLFVKGNFQILETLNDVDFPQLCKFIYPSKNKMLKIKGNTYFAKGPYVKHINGKLVSEFQDNAWFVDKPATFTENINFSNNIHFSNNISLQGLLNDVDLRYLSQHYLSKSRDQETSANLNFLKDAIFKDDVITAELIIKGKINGIEIDAFTRSVLLHRPQLFENELYLENCLPNDVNGDYLVNKLNLRDDVMRYDKLNIATGKKQFNNFLTDNLKMDKNVNVQGVDIIDWLTNAVLTNGTFNIAEKKSFTNATFQNGLSLMERLNKLSFNEETVLLKHSPQNITGQKSFMHEIPGEIKFKALKVKGLVNNADIGELVLNQASKKGHNIFKSEVTFDNNITTKNINFEKLYQNINVTELLVNLTKLESLNNFNENYGSLLVTSNLIETSLKNQAFYLYDLKPIESIPGVNQIFSITDSEESKLIAFYEENGRVVIRLLTWNEENKMFDDMEGLAMILENYPTYIQKVTVGNVDHIYIEQESAQTEDNTHEGRLIIFDINNITRFNQLTFLTKGTFHLTSFDIALFQYRCLLFNDYELDINIVCANPDEEYHLYQVIKSEKAHMVSVLTIDSSPYIIAVRKGNDTDQPRTSIWKFNATSALFEIHQIIYEGEPISMSTLSTPYGHYIATAYGYIRNTMDFGKIVIRKFDYETKQFTRWQNINVNAPITIEFALLPSSELALYVLTEDPVAPFNVYLYEGISSFTKMIAGTAISNALNMNQFTINKGHFIIMQGYDEITIIQALFKGTSI